MTSGNQKLKACATISEWEPGFRGLPPLRPLSDISDTQGENSPEAVSPLTCRSPVTSHSGAVRPQLILGSREKTSNALQAIHSIHHFLCSLFCTSVCFLFAHDASQNRRIHHEGFLHLRIALLTYKFRYHFSALGDAPSGGASHTAYPGS